MPEQPQNTPPRPAKLDLPFSSRRVDPGEWAYDHRVGLCVMIITYLVAGIIFVSTRIHLTDKSAPKGFYIEFEQEATPVTPEQIEQYEQLQRMANDDFSNIRNRISNENASDQASWQGGAAGSPGRSVATDQLAGEAVAVDERLSANRRAWEKGLGEERDIAARRNAAQQQENPGAVQGGDVKQSGKVMVSFSLANPIRYSDGPNGLFIPGYQCRGGGELILSVTVNRNGKVTSATPKQASASVDDCMLETAVKAALASRFNVDGSAPDKHQGTITYVFKPQ